MPCLTENSLARQLTLMVPGRRGVETHGNLCTLVLVATLQFVGTWCQWRVVRRILGVCHIVLCGVEFSALAKQPRDLGFDFRAEWRQTGSSKDTLALVHP